MAFGMFFCTLHDTTESIVCQEKRAVGSQITDKARLALEMGFVSNLNVIL